LIISGYAELDHREAVVLDDDLFSSASREVDDQIGALSRSKNHALEFNRSRQQSLIRSDLVKRLAVRQR
jgi:hypothetical protein